MFLGSFRWALLARSELAAEANVSSLLQNTVITTHDPMSRTRAEVESQGWHRPLVVVGELGISHCTSISGHDCLAGGYQRVERRETLEARDARSNKLVALTSRSRHTLAPLAPSSCPLFALAMSNIACRGPKHKTRVQATSTRHACKRLSGAGKDTRGRGGYHV